jgi:hypothetical protein
VLSGQSQKNGRLTVADTQGKKPKGWQETQEKTACRKRRERVFADFINKSKRRAAEVERRCVCAREAAVAAWTTPETEKTVMDVVLAQAFADILMKHMYAPHLGCATTRALLEELKARAEVDGSIDYSTVTQL